MSPSSQVQAPAPFSLSPSWSFDGDDGKWSTFSISVGTPPQSFRILPSTTGAETWVPISLGCEGPLSTVADCGTLRGANDFEGKPSRGFDTDASSTWDLIGAYELATEQNLWGGSDNQGLYGLDVVSLDQYDSSKDVKLASQTVAGVASEHVWIGSLGMGSSPANFTIKNKNIPSLIDTMKKHNIIPSMSYGYTAGASYANTPGSLTIGGYDQARFKPNKLNLAIGGFKDQNLPVTLESITVENSLVGILSMLPNAKPINTIIDSTVSQMWLPQGVCDQMAKAFGLTYDQVTGLYLVNNTIHDQLRDLNPSITFNVGGQDSSSPNTNIVLPYAAFDLQASLPLYNTSTNYFPLKVAKNESQQVLGRAFLQEAYVFVDWERKSFTIGQAIHQNKTTDIVTVLPPTYESNSPTLSTSLIAAIAVGACALIAVVICLTTCFVMRRRRRRRERQAKEGMPIELQGSLAQLHEIGEGHPKHELCCTQVSELQAESVEQELEGEGERAGRLKEKWDVYELP